MLLSKLSLVEAYLGATDTRLRNVDRKAYERICGMQGFNSPNSLID